MTLAEIWDFEIIKMAAGGHLRLGLSGSNAVQPVLLSVSKLLLGPLKFQARLRHDRQET